jgi:hypothetical protein
LCRPNPLQNHRSPGEMPGTGGARLRAYNTKYQIKLAHKQNPFRPF